MKTADENANVLGVDFFQKAYKKAFFLKKALEK